MLVTTNNLQKVKVVASNAKTGSFVSQFYHCGGMTVKGIIAAPIVMYFLVRSLTSERVKTSVLSVFNKVFKYSIRPGVHTGFVYTARKKSYFGMKHGIICRQNLSDAPLARMGVQIQYVVDSVTAKNTMRFKMNGNVYIPENSKDGMSLNTNPLMSVIQIGIMRVHYAAHRL